MAFAISAATPSIAHRGHDGLTLVTLAKDGKVTVSHRFEAHDVEPMLARIAPDAQSSLDDPDAVRTLVNYLEARFRLNTGRSPIALRQQKVDVTSDIVQVDFVGKMPLSARSLSITNALFDGLRTRQVNQVNVRRGNVVRTLTFDGAGTQRIMLSGPVPTTAR